MRDLAVILGNKEKPHVSILRATMDKELEEKERENSLPGDV
ncbi:MAG TPA: hypothetical protein VFS65_00775 [Candidatus Saccharimonadales bacterium]|nr:hypothetical protein [Candidatus Saccharimonadales bacterium]